LRAQGGVPLKATEPPPSQLVVEEEGKNNPGRGVNGEGAILYDEIRSDEQRNREQSGKGYSPAGTKHRPAKPFRG